MGLRLVCWAVRAVRAVDSLVVLALADGLTYFWDCACGFSVDAD